MRYDAFNKVSWICDVDVLVHDNIEKYNEAIRFVRFGMNTYIR